MKNLVVGENTSKLRNLFMTLLVICFLSLNCAGLTSSVVVNSSKDSDAKKVTCTYPFNPSSTLVLLILYKDAMRYLTKSTDICRHTFAKKLKKEVQSTFFLSQGCITATLNDIDDALYHPSKLRKRLNY